MAKDIQEIAKKTFLFEDFRDHAMDLFQWHYKNNPIYHEYCHLLKIKPSDVRYCVDIPFLPIDLFKSKKILVPTSNKEIKIFESSGTTGSISSKHYIYDLKLYKQSILQHFTNCYGNPSQYNFLALLPNYLECNNSSLIYMIDYLMKMSPHKKHGFYLYDLNKLNDDITKLQSENQKIFLIGVTYALLDFAEKFPRQLEDKHIVMETGGMKGRKKELTRVEVHNVIKKHFQIAKVHSEFGMTELLSQSYSSDGIHFFAPNWVKVFVHDIYNPLAERKNKGKGVINIIDFANVYSCPFIATNDQGELFENGTFSVEGRVDHADTRGCSLMYSNE